MGMSESTHERQTAPAGTCRCGAAWSGLRTAHCAAEGCHETFTALSTFDAHRTREGGGACLEPLSVDLVERGPLLRRGAGAAHVWGNPAMTPEEVAERWPDRPR